MLIYSFDIDLGQKTLVLKLDLDMVYLHTKKEVPIYSGSKVTA